MSGKLKINRHKPAGLGVACKGHTQPRGVVTRVFLSIERDQFDERSIVILVSYKLNSQRSGVGEITAAHPKKTKRSWIP
jgi:hypothetical protein